MKNSGFTLIEVLAVVAVMAILVVIVAPNVIELYREGLKRTMQSEEANILDAAHMFEQDHCTNPIDNTYECPVSYTQSKFICLSNLKTEVEEPGVKKVTSGLITKNINYQGIDCEGIIIFSEKQDKTYLACGTSEEGYFTDSSVFDGNSSYDMSLCERWE